LEPNAGVIVTSISNKSKLYLTGGFGKGNTLLVNSTIIYDPSTNGWTTVPNTLSFYA
jgi:N-acetylneuraminic acid mutarotase